MENARMKDSDFIQFVQWGFQALLLLLVTWGVSELAGVNRSIQDLNIKMAVMIEKNENHEKRIEKLEGFPLKAAP
jgi:hypothetical protein